MSDAHRSAGDGKAVALTAVPTAVGPMTLAVTEQALVHCGFDTPAAVRARLLRAGLDTARTDTPSPAQAALLSETRVQLAAYLSGERCSFSLPLDLCLTTPFAKKTVLALESVAPYGHTTTYGQLAKALSHPRAARAVGLALATNPLCVVLPCHRVITSTGRPSGYAGGLPAKHFLLELEASAAR